MSDVTPKKQPESGAYHSFLKGMLGSLFKFKEHLIIHRLIAFAFDVALCVQLSAILFIIIFPHLNKYFGFPENFFFEFHLVFVLYILWAYYVLTESTKLHGSLGKRIVGLRVLKAKGGTLSLLQSTIRSLLAPFSLLAGGLGFFMAAFNKYHLAWHDVRSHSIVLLSDTLS